MKWKNYEHVDLKAIIQCPTNKLVDKHNEAPLNAFPGSVMNHYSSKAVDLPGSTQDRQNDQAREYVVPGMT